MKKALGNLDKIVGQNIKQFRKERSITQMDLGELMKISYQQVQKYENGRNRISAVNLYRISKYLNVPIDCFF